MKLPGYTQATKPDDQQGTTDAATRLPTHKHRCRHPNLPQSFGRRRQAMAQPCILQT